MQLSKVLVPALFLALTGTVFAQPQPAETPKTETTDEFLARYQVERKARTTTEFQKQLREKFKLSDEDVTAIQLFIARQDAQLKIVRKALYQVTLAMEDAALSDDEYALFWSDFQTLLANYRKQKAQDAAKLGEQIHMGEHLRLQSFLVIRGVFGDDLVAATPLSQTFMDSAQLRYNLKTEMGADKPQRVVVPNENPKG